LLWCFSSGRRVRGTDRLKVMSPDRRMSALRDISTKSKAKTELFFLSVMLAVGCHVCSAGWHLAQARQNVWRAPRPAAFYTHLTCLCPACPLSVMGSLRTLQSQEHPPTPSFRCFRLLLQHTSPDPQPRKFPAASKRRLSPVMHPEVGQL
jgi:hypothetical protein